MAKRKKKRQRSTAQASQGFDLDTLVNLNFAPLPDGSWQITGTNDEDVRLIHETMRSKYGIDTKHSVLPADIVTPVDAHGQPTSDTSKIVGLRMKNTDQVIPLKKGERLYAPGQAAVTTYLYCLERLLEGSRRVPGTMRMVGGNDPEEGVRLSRKLWAAMRNAKIFEIPRETYGSFVRTAIEEFNRQISYVNQPLDPSNVDFWREEIQQDADLLGRDMPFPDPMPFEFVYLGIGDGVVLSQHGAQLRVTRRMHHRLAGARLLGYLLMAGEIYEMVFVETTDEDNFLLPCLHYHAGSWDAGRTLSPWVVSDMIDLLNSHRVVVEQGKPSLNLKTAFKRQNKATREHAIPPPYYTIRMQDQFVTATASQGSHKGGEPVRKLGYRHDREAHERVLVRRGELPLSPADRVDLEQRGYRVYTSGLMSAEDLDRLARRRKQSRRPDEWLAIKAVHIEATIIGSEDLPYIPGVRVPQTGKERKIIESRTIPSILEPQ